MEECCMCHTLLLPGQVAGEFYDAVRDIEFFYCYECKEEWGFE